jgi:Cof subfamily protein (haloacid dehalogenase superfamily)
VHAFPPPLAALPDGLQPGGRFAAWRPRAPRYVVLDVDGTLLGTAGQASPPVASAVRACLEAGLPVGLATGRMPAACRALAEQIGLTGPHVVHNGAEVRADGPVRRWPLSRAHVEGLLGVCRRRGLYAELYVGDSYVVTDRREAAHGHWALLGGPPAGTVDEVELGEVVKGTVLVFDDADLEAVLDDLAGAGLDCGPAHAPSLPEVTFVNVTARGADKGRAVAVAAEHLGLTLDQVLAVGDGLNDLSMLRAVGTAVAMGQALPEVRAAAHLVVPDCDADGVVHALEAAMGWRAVA